MNKEKKEKKEEDDFDVIYISLHLKLTSILSLCSCLRDIYHPCRDVETALCATI